jgi:hypothetical protein
MVRYVTLAHPTYISPIKYESYIYLHKKKNNFRKISKKVFLNTAFCAVFLYIERRTITPKNPTIKQPKHSNYYNLGKRATLPKQDAQTGRTAVIVTTSKIYSF